MEYRMQIDNAGLVEIKSVLFSDNEVGRTTPGRPTGSQCDANGENFQNFKVVLCEFYSAICGAKKCPAWAGTLTNELPESQYVSNSPTQLDIKLFLSRKADSQTGGPKCYPEQQRKL
ncbi:hypothetical protein EVAR_82835_1 [Eumeta japonica]|uniref:Uncharacterized protein n=1 Tax=Eumeta variegata TaxID=151549 RepID=A0A4C1V3Y3_EUMVA|nr:hypothetical protein EVAR_82835_1 [Eumeta japonica]